MVENLVIIGSGPAAYTAAIYVARAGINVILFAGFNSGPVGGQLMTTTMVENFPGFVDGIMGQDLMERLKNQALKFETRIILEDVVDVDFSSHPYKVISNKREIETNSIIIATGSRARRLDIKGANEFWQKGVSTCAICDGAAPIFRNRPIVVVGGGDSAMEEALFLTKFASKVYIVHRRDAFKAAKILSMKVVNHPKIEILWNSEVIEILGEKVVEKIILKNNTSNEKKKIDTAGVFFAIGHIPNTGFLKNKILLNENGYIIVKKGSTYTEKEGVFAAGDVQDFIYRQAIVAAGTGCMAALDAQKWLYEKGYVT